MGVYGCMKFAFSRGLVRSQAAVLPLGTKIPVAVDLWNVIYGLMERSFPRRAAGDDDAALTMQCLYSLLRMLHRRAYYPIFVSDRGMCGEGKATHGAKAIVASAVALGGGSGRLNVREFAGDDDAAAARGPRRDRRWSGGSDGAGRGAGEEGEGDEEEDGGEGEDDDGEARCRACGAGEYDGRPRRLSRRLSRRRASAEAGEWGEGRYRRQSVPRDEAPRVLHRLCLDAIRLLGFPYVNATDMEADDLCANLYHTKTVPYVLSSDTDMLLLGCDIIVDLAHIFPLVIRCRDVLAELGIDYPTFLARFVRCHTDLHKEPHLKSMQEVIEAHRAEDEERTAAAGGQDAAAAQCECGASAAARRRKRARRRSLPAWRPVERRRREGGGGERASGEDEGRRPAGDDEDEGESGPRCVRLHQTHRAYEWGYGSDEDAASAFLRGDEPTKGALRALAALRPPRTRAEVLERRFIKHVVGILTPERRTPRVSILKRIPIEQDARDDDALRDLITRALADRAEADSVAGALINRVPLAQPYNQVLIKYWD